ncbi:hypothetical protein P1P75_03025 [Streptomyces sp. ID05-39B]|uniref:hypothetical protein n=1 Tax=Streptomyces sp. ID05-39B TaxID=3028664 RepID=UPI0029B4567C|nr:hypothetical protein [Streptomyces sp. ID05-39B]MDX3525432.1 hypothetical protein [Streptomyces sp. ID05-39B]
MAEDGDPRRRRAEAGLPGAGIDWFGQHQAALASYVAGGLFAGSLSVVVFPELPGTRTPRARFPLEVSPCAEDFSRHTATRASAHQRSSSTRRVRAIVRYGRCIGGLGCMGLHRH